MIGNAVNFVAFQVCWFASVLGAAAGRPWIGPVVVVSWVAVHLALNRREAGVELRLVVAAAVLGWSADSTLTLAGLLWFPDPAQLGGPSPLWMAGLWAAFATSLRHSLGWLRGRRAVAVALGAIAGPLAYLGGEALGAIALAGPVAILAVGVEYAVATPLLVAFAGRAEAGGARNGPPTAAASSP